MRRLLIATVVAATFLVPIGAVSASEVVETALVSRGTDGTLSNGRDSAPTISADGNIIAYKSGSTNLVPHDYNGVEDIFAFDRVAGVTYQVSLGMDGSPSNGHSRAPAISADGNTIAYYSDATNIVANDTNGFLDVFTYDRSTGVTRRVSVASDGSEGNGHSQGPSVSGDGNIIVFESDATNLVANDTNNRSDIFAYDLATGTTTRVSVATDGAQGNYLSSNAAISADGRTVVYESYASNLVPNDTNAASDIFAYDLATGTTTRVSVASDGTQVGSHSTRPAVSADGMTIAYMSGDIFAYDRNTGIRTRVSLAFDGSQADAGSWYPTVSGDGSTIAYSSAATNLVPSDTNNDPDVFVHNLIDGTTTRVSEAADGTESNDESQRPAISADGTTIAYESEATNLVSGAVGPYLDIFATDIGNAPEASGFSAAIAEDMPVGTELGTVTASDADGDPLSYGITTGNEAGVFAISGSGTVSLAGALDFETTSHYDLTVTISDGGLSDTATATIDVTDVNEPPNIFGFTATVAENAPIDTVLGTVSASDPENDGLTFAIITGNDNGVFAIDNDGVVSVAGAIDYETTSSYDLNVEVSDDELFDTAIVTVAVTNVNESPTAEDFDTTVPEDTALGAELGAVRASDPDNDPLSFAITAGNEPGLFGINGAGVVTVVAAVDYQTAMQHVLTVTVSDGKLSDTATVTINVTEASDVDPDAGPFTDTVGSTFAVDVEWLATSGITQGCNPPVNDEFCPDDFVTRGQMAAFLVRGLDLPATSDDYFDDDDGSIFEDAINRLAASGITKGCNPPTNDTFCPNGNVTRGQMAAFLVRGLDLPATSDDYFDDDDGSIFEDAIDKLAAAGVTRGCNPPADTEYCPNNNVTRGQMAAFLHRAFG